MANSDRGNDVIIIGAGVIGCAIADRLVRRNLRVTVVERGAVGREASWAAAGIIDPGSFSRGDELATIRRRSVAMFGDWVADVSRRAGRDATRDLEYAVCGALDLITDDNQEAAADREFSVAGQSGDVQRLSAEQVLALEPAVTPRMRGALLKRRVAQVRNPRLMQALRTVCEQAGAAFRENTPVDDLLVEGGRVRGVITPGGRLTADRVVLAAGAWSTKIGDKLSGIMNVHPVRGQIALLQAAAPPLRHVLQHGNHYLVCRADGQILAGSTQEHEAGFDKRPTAHAIGQLLTMAERFVPSLKDAALLQTWAGLRPGTRDGKPWLGPVPGLDGLIAATGHFRSGFTLAPLTAEAIEAFVIDGQDKFGLSFCRPGR